jgi:hypothetical protein
VVPAYRFISREGAVEARVELEAGEPTAPFSLVAYRLRPIGKVGPPVLYRSVLENSGGRMQQHLLVWPAGCSQVHFEVLQPANSAASGKVLTPKGSRSFAFQPGKTFELDLAPEIVSEVIFEFDLAPGATPPELSLARN